MGSEQGQEKEQVEQPAAHREAASGRQATMLPGDGRTHACLLPTPARGLCHDPASTLTSKPPFLMFWRKN